MNEIFVSYKSEDAPKVLRLVRALESAGLSLWWDRRLAAAESWDSQIRTALESAKCVVVVWTQQSVGPAGDFVRDEARHAKRRGVLVPVKLEKVDPPPGFGELQAVDLSHWKGSARDPFFQDLLAAVIAKIEGRHAPPAKGPLKRLTRRLTLGSVASGIALCVGAFGSNSFGTQERVCALPILQPHISDFCGAFGFGMRPAKDERIAWGQREIGSCEALRLHLQHFPSGAYRAEAAGQLAARRVTGSEIWTPSTRRLSLFQRETDAASTNRSAAETAALTEAQPKAEQLCKGFAATTAFRFTSAKPSAQGWNCEDGPRGISCGFEGEAVCELEQRSIQEKETCGK